MVVCWGWAAERLRTSWGLEGHRGVAERRPRVQLRRNQVDIRVGRAALHAQRHVSVGTRSAMMQLWLHAVMERARLVRADAAVLSMPRHNREARKLSDR